MRLRTLFLFLIGNRQAILDIAADRRAVWIGLLFVLSAGLAREYDGEDLVHEPWHALIPVVASLIASFLLYTGTYVLACGDHISGPSFLAGYRSFLGLFWMTAPLAWLYAIPYERFLTPLEATQANLWTLALVALWRVLLMSRVVGVLMGYGLCSLFPVLTFADAVMLVGLYIVPLPLFDMMGGIRLAPEEHLIAHTVFTAGFFGMLTLPVWLIASIIWFYPRKSGAKPDWPPFDDEPKPIGLALPTFAVASVAVWVIFLPYTQPEQILRWRVERLMDKNEIGAALQMMSDHSRDDFPPHWDPPPRLRQGQNHPPLLHVLDVLAADLPAPWVRAIYMKKLERLLASPYLGDDEFPRIAALIKRLPEGAALLDTMRTEVGKDDWQAGYVKHNLEEIEKIGKLKSPP